MLCYHFSTSLHLGRCFSPFSQDSLIVSSSIFFVARFTLPLLEYVGLASYFKAVVAGDTLAQRKPHPAPLLYACEQLGVEPSFMLMVGDSLNDAQAARAAGCPIFCVNYGYNEGQDVSQLDVDAIVGSLVEVSARITRHDSVC